MLAQAVVASMGRMGGLGQFRRPAGAGAGKDERKFVTATFALIGKTQRIQQPGQGLVGGALRVGQDHDGIFHGDAD